MTNGLKRKSVSQVEGVRRQAMDAATLATVAPIVNDIRDRGLDALLDHAHRLEDLHSGEAYLRTPEDLQRALKSLPSDTQDLLHRAADRIRRFAEAQKACLSDLTFAVPGGRAGHTVARWNEPAAMPREGATPCPRPS